MSVCEVVDVMPSNLTCTPLTIESGRLLNKATLQLTVPGLLPKRKYRVAVTANQAVRDGLGQPLQASSAEFMTMELPTYTQGPTAESKVLVFEPASFPSSWPYLVQGESYRAESWSLDIASEADAIKLLPLLGGRDRLVSETLGRPSNQVLLQGRAINSTSLNTSVGEVALPLQAGRAVHVVATCCRQLNWDGGRSVSSDVQVLLKTGIQTSWVMSQGRGLLVWVVGNGSPGSATPAGPVAGARAWVFAGVNSWTQTISLVGSCITGADGSCSVLPSPSPNQDQGLTAVVVAPAGDVMITPSVGYWTSRSARSDYVAAVVLDRSLARPGDQLHVTGYLQQLGGQLTGRQQLQDNSSAAASQQQQQQLTGLPNISQALLLVQPSWDDSQPGNPARLVVPISGDYGSMHGVFAVPASAKPGRYSINLLLAPSGDLPPDANGTAPPTAQGRRLASLLSSSSAQTLLSGQDPLATPGADSSTEYLDAEPLLARDSLVAAARALRSSVMMSRPGQSQMMMGIAPQTTNGGGGVAAPSFDFSSLLTVKSVEFTIADPRPPTADLVVKAPSWALPNASVVVTLTATSYLGSSVASAPITLDWSAGNAKGIVNTTTDSTGSATATIDLGKVPADSAPSSGEQLSVRAQWVGPTREVIARTATVSLQTSRRRLEVTRNLDTNTPGVAWGVKTTVTDTESGSQLKGVPVLVSLQVKDAGTANCSTSAACNTSSGSPAEACQLMLPCTGKFELQACTTDEQGGGVPACANVTLGHTWEYWTTHPLLAHDTPTLTANASSYAPGAVAGLSFQNPWPNASALMVWGNDLSSLSKQLSQVPSGLVTLALPLGPECLGGCSVSLLLAVPRVTANASAAVTARLPTSRLFDPTAPHMLRLSVDLTVQENRDLEVKLTIGQAGNSSTTGQAQTIVAPGAQTNISVAVSRQGQSVADAEVTLVAVDKAVLDLLPLPLAGLVPDLIVKLLPYLSEVNMGDAMVSPSALDEVLNSVRRRLALDPWISPDLAITPSKGLPSWQRGSGMASVDMNDTAFFQRLFTAITYGLGGSWQNGASISFGGAGGSVAFAVSDGMSVPAPAMIMPSMAMPLAMVADKSAASAAARAPGLESAMATSAPASSSPRLSSSFQTTPLFTTLRTAADGQGIATFTAPANLGTFVVRAYAVSKGGQALGSAEGQLVVRRSVSITASLPRAVRINDTFQAGVLVTAPGYAGPGLLPVTVSVQVVPAASSDAVAQGPLQLLSQSATANVTLTPEATQQEVRFNFSASSLGSATLLFNAEDNSGAGDALQVNVPVLAQQGAVILATSFALRPSNSSQGPSWQEGLVLPQAVPGSGALGLVAGVGYLPALQTAFQGILSQITARDPSDPSASLALVLALLPTTLATYSQNLTAEQAGNVTTAVTSLQQLTHSAYGLLPSLPGKWGWTPTRADIQLNSWAAWLISNNSQALDQAAVADPLLAGLAPGLNSLSSSTAARWKEAAVQQLLKDATELRKPPRNTLPPQNYSDWTTLAWVRLAMGAEWQPPLCSDGPPSNSALCAQNVTIRADLSLPNLLAAVEPHDSASSAKLLTATALLATGNTSYSSFIASVADGLLSSIRVQAQTAYVAASKGAKRAAGLDIQALALGLLTALARPSEAVLLPKLALYVAQQGNTRLDLSAAYWPISPSTQAVGLSIRSLAAYDVTAGSASPDLQLEVAAGNTSLLQASFRSNSSTTASSTTPWSALASPPGPLSFQVQGRGEASLAASLNFVPALLLPYPTYRGLWLEAVVQATDPQTGQAVGPALAGAPLGALLMVTLQLSSPDDLGQVSLVALVPGGLEPLDPLVPGSGDRGGGVVCALGGLTSGSASLPWLRSWWWPVCPAMSVLPSKVSWQWQALMSGTHSLSFTAVAATEGVFVLPPIRAQADNQPEVMGMTAGSTFTVGPAGSAALPLRGPDPSSSSAATLPQSCPANCNGNGACNILNGSCVCSSGWQGLACGEQAPAF
ncbi:hypothetical protein V8C86DRAFT_462822 [Haematococcus lacustris]